MNVLSYVENIPVSFATNGVLNSTNKLITEAVSAGTICSEILNKQKPKDKPKIYLVTCRSAASLTIIVDSKWEGKLKDAVHHSACDQVLLHAQTFCVCVCVCCELKTRASFAAG